MSYTVWGAFDSFRKNNIDLTPTESENATNSKGYLFQQLKLLDENNAYFPLLFGKYLSFGSFARKTKIRPLDDIDFLLLLNGKGTMSTASTVNSYEYWLKIKADSAPLSLFPDEYGYVNSTKVLNSIKSGLSAVPNYNKADIKRTGEAITLNLSSYPWVFDIVPAVPIADSTGRTSYYLIPDGSGDWKATDPRKDQAYITRVNQQHTSLLIPTIRILKYWNNRITKPVLESYYFETLALKVFDYAPKITDFPHAIDYFFRNFPTYLWGSCPDPKGLGPALDINETFDRKQKIASAASTASSHAAWALYYEVNNKPEQAINSWENIFGSSFPSYG